MLSVDVYLNETTRHAQLILPPTSALEHDHYDLAFHKFAVRNTARYNAPVLPKPAGALHDWEIFAGLAAAHARLTGEPAAPVVPPAAHARLPAAGRPLRRALGVHAAAQPRQRCRRTRTASTSGRCGLRSQSACAPRTG